MKSPHSPPRQPSESATGGCQLEDGRVCESTIVGRSPAFLEAVGLAEQIARTAIPVLIIGATGTGKELLAQHIHRRSRRAGQLMSVDCGALPESLAESILFGHDKGAFTGAVHQVSGLIAEGDGGTLFLDELSSLPASGQAKLLRVLETGEVRRVGSSATTSVDLRVVATVQEDFPELVSSGAFRSDLLQRVAGAIIRLPALDQRAGDVRLLARHFAEPLGATITSDAELLLERYRWPGNVRELRWAVARAAHLGSDRVIGTREVEQAMDMGPRALFRDIVSTEPSRNDVPRLRAACEANCGNPIETAKALGIGRSTLYRRLSEAGLDLRHFRTAGAEPAEAWQQSTTA